MKEFLCWRDSAFISNPQVDRNIANQYIFWCLLAFIKIISKLIQQCFYSLWLSHGLRTLVCGMFEAKNMFFLNADLTHYRLMLKFAGWILLILYNKIAVIGIFGICCDLITIFAWSSNREIVVWPIHCAKLDCLVKQNNRIIRLGTDCLAGSVPWVVVLQWAAESVISVTLLVETGNAYLTTSSGLLLKPPLHRAATFVPPLCDHKNGSDAQGSPEPRKFCFCVTAAARPLCLPWTTKVAVVAQQVAQRRQSGGRTVAMVAQVLPWSLNGGRVVATVIAQWTPLVGQRRHKEGRRVARIDTQCSHFLLGDQWPTTVHPFCDHGDVCAFILPPLSDLWATDLLGDLCATVLNMLKTSRRPWRPWRCLNVLCATLERPRQPFCLLSAFNDDLARFVVAQGRHKGRSPCVKGVLGS